MKIYAEYWEWVQIGRSPPFSFPLPSLILNEDANAILSIPLLGKGLTQAVTN